MDGSEKAIWALLRDADVAQFLRQALESDQTSLTREFVLDAASGPRILSFALMPLVLDGRIQGSMLLVQDVTERKSRESRLRRAESLASLTTLAAGVAHEIKNPLGSMGIHIQLIQRALKAGPPLDQTTLDHDLGVINEEINRLNGIVVDFLFAVRPMDTTLILGSLNKTITELAEFLGPELAQAGIQTSLDLEKGDDTVLMDERFLKQALLNLVKNSMHAHGRWGTAFIQHPKTADGLTLKLVDSGTGIPVEVMEKIFEPYFTTKDFGSGLGLTLVYKIVKEHGADIPGEFQGWSGNNGHHRVSTAAQDTGAAGFQGRSFVKLTILVADDEKNIREGLARALELDGYEVLMAEDGRQAMDFLQKRPIDLVLTDLRMPKVSGEELLKYIAGTQPHLPVIVLTGHGTVENAGRGDASRGL